MSGEILIYNSLSGKKEKFTSIEPNKVKMYACGPTVYDLLHVGNFRGAVVFNFVRNWLEKAGYEVNYVYNFTDVDDKIINRAKEKSRDPGELSEHFIGEFKKDYSSLGLKPHTHNPKVTESMGPIVEMIDQLIEKNHAYVVDGEVLYAVRSFAEYGKLSHRNIDDLRTGTRIEPGERKKDALDFALWKPAKAGEPSWPSPWGPGRPGWHIECSAMIKSLLGDEIDIHCGGMDLIFPHHENEIAQSEGCTHKNFSRYWMHNNMINFAGTKMSKSLGNIISLRQFVSEQHPEIFKFLILSSHYRSIVELSEASTAHVIQGLARIYSSLALADSYLSGDTSGALADKGFDEAMAQNKKQIEGSFNDDFNTAQAMGFIFDSIRQFNGRIKRGQKITPQVLGICQSFRAFISWAGETMALFGEKPEAFLVALDDKLLAQKNLTRDQVEAVMAKRKAAREAKDFAQSDVLRAELTQMGIAVSDTPQGAFWEVAK